MNTIVLVVADFVVFYLALFLALSTRVGGVVDIEFYFRHLPSFTLLFFILGFLLYMAGFYSKGFRSNAKNVFNSLITTLFFFTIVTISLFYFLPIFGLTPKITFVLFVSFLFPLLFLCHFYTNKILRVASLPVILVGSPPLPRGFDIVSIIPVNSDTNLILSSIASAHIQNGINRVIIDFKSPQLSRLLPGLHTLMLSGIVFLDKNKIDEEWTGRVNLNYVDEEWLLQALQKRNLRTFLVIKRILDIVVSLLLMPIYLLLLPIVALAIKLQDGGKVFVVQERLGQNRQIFKLYKFRTMTLDDDGKWHKDQSSVVTKVGAFLRRSRIDELPQLWNVLKGDISMIGPRPDMFKLGRELADKIRYYNARYIVRPGLTGWAQVSQGVIPQSVEESRERLAYDLYYIKNLSVFLELKIIIRTVKLLLFKIFIKRS